MEFLCKCLTSEHSEEEQFQISKQPCIIFFINI